MSVTGNASVKTRLIKAARCIKWIVSKTGHVFNNKRQYEKKRRGFMEARCCIRRVVSKMGHVQQTPVHKQGLWKLWDVFDG